MAITVEIVSAKENEPLSIQMFNGIRAAKAHFKEVGWCYREDKKQFHGCWVMPNGNRISAVGNVVK